MHPRSKHWHLLDYILVRQRDQNDVSHTRVMPSAECHTDHRLVRCKLKLCFKPKPKSRGPLKKKLDLAKLKQPQVEADFQTEIQAKFEGRNHTEPSPELLWDQLKSTILPTSEEVIGFTERKHRDWFDENDTEILEMLSKKHSAHQAHLSQPSCPAKKAAFRQACGILQQKLRKIQDKWWIDLAERTQWCADTGDKRGF